MSWRYMSSMFTSQDRTDQDDVQAYTIKSHGIRVVRTHFRDWLVLALLLAIEVILNQITPYHRFVGRHMMTDLKYPLQPNTIPFWSVYMYAILLPIIIFIIRYIRRRDVHDLHHAILGLLYAILFTAVITDAIKDGVGRPRPDFFWRCFPNGKESYDRFGNVKCTGDPHVIREGHKSFPSGHTSWSFAGLGFLMMYLSGKFQVFDQRGHASKLCVVFLPLLAASMVAVTRVDDYWHHWQDVLVGGLIGLTVSIFCYLQFFPSPHHTKGWGPYSYFRAVDEDTLADRHTNASNGPPPFVIST